MRMEQTNFLLSCKIDSKEILLYFIELKSHTFATMINSINWISKMMLTSIFDKMNVGKPHRIL